MTKSVSVIRRSITRASSTRVCWPAKRLATVGKLSDEPSLCEWARRAARYVVRRQRADGSWAYGADDYQSWADNFHTAFILTSLSRIIESCESAREEFAPALTRGYEFWRERFFLSNGWPKYFPDRLYPADAHSAGAAMVALAELRLACPGGDRTRGQDCRVDHRQSSQPARLLLLSTASLLHRAHSLHALVRSVDGVRAGEADRRKK